MTGPKTGDKWMLRGYGKVFGCLVLILIGILLSYGNTFHASWHFDDYHVIVENPLLHIEDLRYESLHQTFFASSSGGRYTGKRLYRPVSCLSFGLNWYVGKDNVTGYHIVNVAIHILTAAFIYLCILTLLKTPNIRGRYDEHRHTLALLAALLWAVHPIQTQAVTYIVQRMAALSALFSVISIWFYLKGRINDDRIKQAAFFCGSMLCFLIGLGAKGNAVMLPVSLLLVELIFFRNITLTFRKRSIFGATIICILIVALGIFALYANGLFAGYNERSFTLPQRVMTQPRVVLFYLSQIFLPVLDRFSIEHDFLLSRSLLEPWHTLPAFFAIIGLFVFGIRQMRRWPLFSFSVLFFLLNHVIESSLLPLEMVFEHRNYLPSMFLFLLPALCFVYFQKTLKKKHRYITGAFHGTAIMLVLFLMGTTFLRNDVWATEKTLWEDALRKAPGRARPYQNLAVHHYMKIGEYNVALKLYKKALSLRSPNPSRTRAQLLTNIGAIYDKVGNYETAYDYYMLALGASPKQLKPRYNAAMALIGMGKFDKALLQAEELMLKKPDDRDINNVKGFILLKQGQATKAIPYLQQSLAVDPLFFKAIVNLGIALYQTGQYAQSEAILNRAHELDPKHGLPLFCLLENRLRADDGEGADAYLQNLIDTITTIEIEMVLTDIDMNNHMVPISKEILAPAIKAKYSGQSKATESEVNQRMQ